MVGSVHEGDFKLVPPEEAGSMTGLIYIRVGDIDAHYQRATSAGAVIVRELKETDYGSREYAARDPEGHVWSFGTYGVDVNTEG